MDNRAEDFFLTLFISGLKPQIGRQVSMNRPDTLEEAKIVALSVDASFNAFPLSQNGNNDKKMLLTLTAI